MISSEEDNLMDLSVLIGEMFVAFVKLEEARERLKNYPNPTPRQAEMIRDLHAMTETVIGEFGDRG